MLKKISVWLLIIIGLAVAVDQVSKGWSEANLLVHQDSVDSTIYQGSRRPLVEWGEAYSASNWITFQLNYVRNHGAAWGSFANLSDSVRLPLFHIVTVVFCAFFLGVAFSSGSKISVLTRLALGLMVAGAVGNLVDRVMKGYVVDLLDLRWQLFGWRYALPVFNAADVFVIMGLGLLILTSLRR